MEHHQKKVSGTNLLGGGSPFQDAVQNLPYLEMLSSRDALSRFIKYRSHRSFAAKGK